MKVIKRIGDMKTYPYIVLCDWTEEPSSKERNYSMNLYAISRASMPGRFAPNSGESCLFMFNFETLEEAKKAAYSIMNAEKTPLDYVSHMQDPHLAKCLW